MKRIVILALSMLLASTCIYAREYGKYDLDRMRTIEETSSGKKYGMDEKYLDPMLHDLGFHARNSPPQFDTDEDRKRAVLDVRAMSGMFDAVLSGPEPDTELLVRAGFLNIIGRNLGIPGSAEKAKTYFNSLLKAAPSDPQGNYLYGTFLASEGKTKKALKYLEKALSVGVTDAAYTLGMAYLKLGNKKKALENLEIFRQRSPYHDESVAKLIEDIQSGNKEKMKSRKK